jgi:flagellar basal-body rod protein FlgF
MRPDRSMENAVYIALSRQTALMRQMDLVANNIANSDTAGFKGEHMMFAEYVARTTGTSANNQISYVEDIGVARDTSAGNLMKTGNDLDVAIPARGYFVVQTPAGNRYTRAGSFRVGEGGILSTSNGDPVLDRRGGPIQLPREPGKIEIGRDGTLAVDGRPLGQIDVVGFENEQAMRKTMGGLYTTDAQPQPIAQPGLVQGMIETSNVKPVIETTRMMELLRNFQGMQNMLEGEHERKQRAIREIQLKN